MSINIRRVTEATLQPGQVQTVHLANGAVTSVKIGDGEITSGKIADNAISTTKLQDAVVTLAKASDDVRLHQFAGEESEISAQGTSWTEVKSARFVKSAVVPSTKMRFIGSLKSSVAGMTAHLGVDIDATNELDLTSILDDYELVSGEFDISGLANGRHIIAVKVKSDDPTAYAYNDHIDIMFVK